MGAVSDMRSPQSRERTTSAPPSRREQAIELAVFLFMIVPSMALSLFAVRQQRVSFPLAAIAIIFRDLALLALVRFFVWRNGEPPRCLGWVRRGAAKEVLLGIALFIPIFILIAALEVLLKAAGLSAPTHLPPALLPERRGGELLLATVLVLVVAFVEETVFRGYLMLRFQALTKSRIAIVLLSSVVFSLGHGYEGSAGVVAVGVLGAVFAVVYLWRGSLVAPITMHFLQDFVSIVVLPLLVTGPALF
jgi:membrane protease YdiL (CAAX protease family)